MDNMNTPSPLYPAADQPPLHAGSGPEEEHLRDILKRCPPATYAAAHQFRTTGDTRHVPAIILGIIERFTESGLREKLREPHDSLMLSEDLGLDSLTLMEIVLLVEDVLVISINNEELRHVRTLGDIRQFIEIKLHDKPRQAQRTG